MTTTRYPTAEGIGRPERAPAELLDVKQTAALVGASQRTVLRLSAAGLMPSPVKLLGLTRWSRRTLLDWIARGCPKGFGSNTTGH